MGAVRGEVWLVRLDPTEGSEIRKTRPCVVISPDELNVSLHTVIIAPLTSKPKNAGFRVPIDLHARRSFVCLDQTRAIAKHRLIKRVGAAEQTKVHQILESLRALFTE